MITSLPQLKRVDRKAIFKVRVLIHLTSLILLTYAFYAAITGMVTGDPVQYLLDYTGIGAINLLLLSLCISPLSRYLRLALLMQTRRTFGVYSAVYATAHLFAFIAFELQYEWNLVFDEILKRPYITVGFVAFLILTLLLFTSPSAVKKKMRRTWQKLHNFVYVASLLAMTHYLWSLKTLTLEPLLYSIALAFLFILRLKRIKKLLKS